MRIGISIGTSFSTDGPQGQRQGPLNVLAQAQAANRAALDSLTVGDHHATGPGGYVQNVPILGRLLAEWTERPVGALFLVPLWHPVGVDLGQRATRLEESIRVVQALLRGERVDSELFGISGAQIAPTPPEGTEWWIGGGVPTAIDRAARLGDCWYGNADLTPETAAGDMDLYREACARHGRSPARIPIRKDVFIAEQRAEAERVGDALVAGGYRGFERAAVAYGDPDSVAEQLSVFGELGFTDIIIRTMSPMPSELGPDAATRSVELAAEVRARLAQLTPR
jgi:alkanesulfonate monooxygenase SsuD/methylene tetrahydromethanopterin reductase-like flavin-dependent oxidoreductase (luciferase family)